MRILITGGAGFIGRHISEHFQNLAEVRVLDDLSRGVESNLSSLHCQLIVGSILDRNLVREAMQGVDFVFHLAAMASVQESMQKPNECAEINSRGTAIVLEEAAHAGVKKLIFSSSSAIYGDNSINPKVETMRADPKNPYASSKYESEKLCCSFTDEGRLATVSLRCFNVYGPYQDLRSEYAAAVPTFIGKAIRNEPITIFGDGQQTRDFIYVKDVVAANAFFALKSRATGVFNVASGRQITITDLALTIRSLTKSSCAIDYAPQRPGDVKYSVADVDKIQAAGVRRACDLAEGLRATIEFFTKILAGIGQGHHS
jgi:nucleoside-diphosphate-sugar epimerase